MRKYSWILALLAALAMIFVGCGDSGGGGGGGGGPTGLATDVIIKGFVDESWTADNATGTKNVQMQGISPKAVEGLIDEDDNTWELEVLKGATVAIPEWAQSNTSKPWIAMDIAENMSGQGGDYNYTITEILFADGDTEKDIFEVLGATTWVEVLTIGANYFGKYGNSTTYTATDDGILVTRTKEGQWRNNNGIVIDIMALAALAGGGEPPAATISVHPHLNVKIAQGGEQEFEATVENKVDAVVEWTLIGAPTGVTLDPATGTTTTVSVAASVTVGAEFKLKAAVQGTDAFVEVDIEVADSSYVAPLWVMSEWLTTLDPEVINWSSRPMRGNVNSPVNATIEDGGVNVAGTNAWDGVDILTDVATWQGSLTLDLIEEEYEIVITGNAIGASSGKIQVGSRLDPWASFGESETLSGTDAEFTVTATITYLNLRPVAQQGIRIRNDAAFNPFRITEITITPKGPAALSASVAAANTALASVIFNNATTADSIINPVKAVIGSNVNAAWTTSFAKTEATDSAAGSITGTITLTLGSDTADIEIDKTIPIVVEGKFFDMQELEDTDAVEAHFAGSANNKGTVSAAGTEGSYVVTVGSFTGSGVNETSGWVPVTIVKAGQAAAGDVLTLNFTITGPTFTENKLSAVGQLLLTRGGANSAIVKALQDNSNTISDSYELEIELTAADVVADITIGWNFWAAPLSSTGVTDTNFAIVIDELTLTRP